MSPTEEPTLLRAFRDSGAPSSSADYTTLILVHGLGFHGGIFKKLLPLAHRHNCRVVLLNRRDYPGSVAYTPEERAEIVRLASSPAGLQDPVAGTDRVMKERARELYDYLVGFVQHEKIPSARGNTGGIILAGWSLGATWLSALLTHVASFPCGAINLKNYVRKIVYYDASYICNGYIQPDGVYHPLHDPDLTPEDRLHHFNQWIGGYFAHGDVWKLGVEAVQSRTPLEHPPATTTTMSSDEVAESTCPSAVGADGTDQLLAMAAIRHGTYRSLKDGAFYLREHPEGVDDWRDIGVRYLWCDHSTWEMALGAQVLAQELKVASDAGKLVRNVDFVRFHGANHFAHWDLPEETLEALL